MVAPAIQFNGERMSVRFDRFDIESYRTFLRCKKLPEYQLEFEPETESYTISAPSRFADVLGVDPPKPPAIDLPFASFLFDDQVYLAKTALDAKRYAVWSGCGNGKTLIGLEYARHVVHRTGGRVLIVTLNEIVPQWIEEAKTFYGDLPLVRLNHREDMREWCKSNHSGIAITNYEKFNPGQLEDQVVNECRYLAGIVLDESSRLKGGGGKQKWALIKSCRGIEYKLSLTATPAPNDTIEFASQASFLEKMRSENDIIWTYFTRDPATQKWMVKPHARQAFFEFMSSWSIYVNNPKAYGWRLDQPEIPKPIFTEVEVPCTAEQREWLQRLTADVKTGQMDLFGGGESTNTIQRTKLSQVAKGFVYVNGDDDRTVQRIDSRKPAVTADIVLREYERGAQVLVWTVFDAESSILSEHLDLIGDKMTVLTGDTKDAERLRILEDFRSGKVRVLISRASMLGYGMNFQCCSAMVFSGWTDSFESLYQAVRRAYRHGQKEAVRVYFPVVRELEGDTLENIQRKEREFESAIAEMELCYIKATKGEWRLAA